MNNSELWSGTFGNEYTKRQKEDKDRKSFFDKALWKACDLFSICEFGANRGDNIKVLQEIFDSEMSAIEINPKCCEELRKIEGLKVYEQSVEVPLKEKFTLVFTRGLLIHLPKIDLDSCVKNIYNCSKNYILIAEYYSPERRMINYRGMDDMLWTDDYFKPFIDMGCSLIDTGFDYKYGISWGLLKK